MLELSRLIVSPHSPAFRKYCLALGLQPFLFLISARSTDSSTCAMFFCDSMSSSPVTLTAIPSICPSSVWYVVAGLTTVRTCKCIHSLIDFVYAFNTSCTYLLSCGHLGELMQVLSQWDLLWLLGSLIFMNQRSHLTMEEGQHFLLRHVNLICNLAEYIVSYEGSCETRLCNVVHSLRTLIVTHKSMAYPTASRSSMVSAVALSAASLRPCSSSGLRHTSFWPKLRIAGKALFNVGLRLLTSSTAARL